MLWFFVVVVSSRLSSFFRAVPRYTCHFTELVFSVSVLQVSYDIISYNTCTGMRDKNEGEVLGGEGTTQVTTAYPATKGTLS